MRRIGNFADASYQPGDFSPDRVFDLVGVLAAIDYPTPLGLPRRQI
jgi:hypothetical protein